MKATLTNYRQSPRKTRLVTEVVKGKSVSEALTALKFLNKRGAAPIAKLIRSAATNAEKQGENARDLFVKQVTVDKGIVAKRFMPRAFGRAAPIRHRMSHVTVTLGKGTGTKKKTRRTKTATRSPI
ncbi:50S ribosomal protein L22 [Candidatus Kaiserbacteria bacterium RIFCSPHIGHO2_01_FULL_48_10]|uniref:Large ribosomal subunit protein uL22 n=1 Tax=Candidatus Kaiserbacteria bacterium RIFCSPHIGHO2_01_FULL_48_10 TaxID=1798476 RepID=A0A1F6C4X8_9BACT|nr:MAG: 50S ribosomal protein L22 [Candidatus Kaiserbacteria bacterium RIFCSPHIGHO2_01_FULL_48_10]